jgi:hypothetical protein
MEKLLAAVKLLGELLVMKHDPEFKAGKGPYCCIDEDDGSSWNLYRGHDGVNYTYGALQPLSSEESN